MTELGMQTYSMLQLSNHNYIYNYNHFKLHILITLNVSLLELLYIAKVHELYIKKATLRY